MIDRRTVLLGAAALLLAPQSALSDQKPFKLDPKHAPKRVRYRGHAPGTIVVDPRKRFLYFVENANFAMRYSVGVGRAGLTFRGKAVVGRKAEWPRWQPTDKMIRVLPWRYARYAKGVPGGPDNPLGARALYLYRDGKDTHYRIHGTNRPSSIGRAVSMGCIRMFNDHVIALYGRVPVGTPVVVL